MKYMLLFITLFLAHPALAGRNKPWGGHFQITMYVPGTPSAPNAYTSTGKRAIPQNRIVAVDPKVIPYGSWIHIDHYGWFKADDCGGLIKGRRLDILTDSLPRAIHFGRRRLFATVIPNI